MLKMSELERRSDTPKSTILYYVKEGLLPEPSRQKANFHLYDESCVEIIEFIKYLQQNFNSTIAQIKALFASENFNANSPYESLLSNLGLIMGADLTKIYGDEELCNEFNITKSELASYVKEGYLVPREGKFTGKEREILAILLNSNEKERELIATYLKTAKEMAANEAWLTIDALSDLKEGRANKNQTLKHLFDILLILKPYLLNMQTFNAYQREKK